MDRSITNDVGFGRPDRSPRDLRPRSLWLELIASAALALSTVFVAAMVTFGTAHAAPAGGAVGVDSAWVQGLIATALVIVLSGYVAVTWQRTDTPQR